MRSATLGRPANQVGAAGCAVSQRIAALIDDVLTTVPEIEADRARIITESYMETEGQPTVTRRARAFEKIMRELPIVIRHNELIVGNMATASRGVQVFPEYSHRWLEDEFDRLEKRPGDPYRISETTKRRLREVFQYWQGKTNSDLATRNMEKHPEVFPAMEADVFTVANYRYFGVGHVSVDYGAVLRKGFRGIIDDAMKTIAALDVKSAEAEKKRRFLEAVIISAQGVIAYANRFAVLARRQADEQSDAKRKRELALIAANCRQVPEHPARTFYEALQSFWFVHAAIQLESNGHSVSPGRVDQYMFPYYEASVINGGLPEEEVRELLDSLWVKLNEVCKVRDEGFGKFFGGYPMFQNINVGGQAADGADAANALSYACLDAGIRTKLPQPSLSVRVWPGTPESLLLKGAELARTGTGMPAWFNDDVVMAGLSRRGVSQEDARDYCILGCVEPNVGGKTLGMHGAAFFNLVRVLESTLNNGMLNGRLVGPQTGDPRQFSSIEDFLAAYRKQMAYFVKLMVLADNAIDSAHAERTPLPYQSSLISDCIARGLSAQEGGARYNMTAVQGVGVANVGDSLMAVKHFVFDRRILSMDGLLSALENNYGRGASADSGSVADKGEYLRQMLIQRSPKYGNDQDEVDMFAREAALIYCSEVEKYPNMRGGVFHAGLYPVSANIPMGRACGATPDGRLAGEPLADGVSPSAGRDLNGPTAAMNSVSKLDHAIASNGALLNQKFHPSALEREEGLANLGALVRSYFERKGSHVQFNVISRETLADAQNNPEQYKDLVVRVAGYSARFVTLDPAIQQDIISRTEQTF